MPFWLFMLAFFGGLLAIGLGVGFLARLAARGSAERKALDLLRGEDFGAERGNYVMLREAEGLANLPLLSRPYVWFVNRRLAKESRASKFNDIPDS